MPRLAAPLIVAVAGAEASVHALCGDCQAWSVT